LDRTYASRVSRGHIDNLRFRRSIFSTLRPIHSERLSAPSERLLTLIAPISDTTIIPHCNNFFFLIYNIILSESPQCYVCRTTIHKGFESMPGCGGAPPQRGIHFSELWRRSIRHSRATHTSHNPRFALSGQKPSLISDLFARLRCERRSTTVTDILVAIHNGIEMQSGAAE
jgi:hypothetical protein